MANIPSIPDIYAPGVADNKATEVPPTHRLSIKDPIGGSFLNVDGGSSSIASMIYQILVELRVLNAQMQQLLAGQSDDVQNLRADQSVAEPLFAQTIAR